MIADDLIATFDYVSGTPAGLQRVREFVLELAFSGRLVAQEADDEPAETLLRRISAGRTRRPPPEPTRDRIPPKRGSLPDTWELVTFSQIADARLGKMLDRAKNQGQLRPYLRNANVQWFRFELGDVHELRMKDDEVEDCTIHSGDLVICEGGEPGRAAVCDASVDGMVIQKALHRVRPQAGIEPWYLAYLLRRDTWSGRLDALFTGATIKHFTGKALAKYEIPLAPLGEQRRIVARIRDLLKLIDDLEVAQANVYDLESAYAAAAVRDFVAGRPF
jgi:type I restriction enzyme, S subunit